MICNNCKKEFIPKQKYCCNACRITAFRSNESVTIKHISNDSVTDNDTVTSNDTVEDNTIVTKKTYSIKNGQCAKHGKKHCVWCK